MKLCAQYGIPCIAIVDNWVNYQQRFLGVSAHELPQLLVVTDAPAEGLVREELPWAACVRWPNTLGQTFVSDVSSQRVLEPAVERYLLWLNEPIRELDGRVCDPLVDVRYAVTLWELIANAVRTRKLGGVIVRFHPSQEPMGYELRSLVVKISNGLSAPLADDVSGAGLCMGVNSYALFLAAQTGIETRSVARKLGFPSSIPKGFVPDY